MTNNHLTDETVQAFLFKETKDDGITMHLLECVECRGKFENYQYLVNNIKRVAPETFSFDVTNLVMDRIMLFERQESRKQGLIFWGLLTFLLIVISSFSIPFVPQILTVFYSIPFFTSIFVVGTGLVVFLFLLADINKQFKMKEEKIFRNKLQPIL